jgi:dihydrofolate reductase
MGKVILSITMSLDGFVAGPQITKTNPMGARGELLHRWLFDVKQKEDEDIMSDLVLNTGAVILGSRTYKLGIHGPWGGHSPFKAPAFVLSSKKLEVIEGFKAVKAGIKTALSQAQAVAKEKDIWIMGGADVAQQYLYGGLVDELRIQIAPMLLTKGARLFASANPKKIELVKQKTVDTQGATHLFFDVRKP